MAGRQSIPELDRDLDDAIAKVEALQGRVEQIEQEMKDQERELRLDMMRLTVQGGGTAAAVTSSRGRGRGWRAGAGAARTGAGLAEEIVTGREGAATGAVQGVAGLPGIKEALTAAKALEFVGTTVVSRAKAAIPTAANEAIQKAFGIDLRKNLESINTRITELSQELRTIAPSAEAAARTYAARARLGAATPTMGQLKTLYDEEHHINKQFNSFLQKEAMERDQKMFDQFFKMMMPRVYGQ